MASLSQDPRSRVLFVAEGRRQAGFCVCCDGRGIFSSRSPAWRSGPGSSATSVMLGCGRRRLARVRAKVRGRQLYRNGLFEQ